MPEAITAGAKILTLGMSQIIFEPLYPYLSEDEMAGWYQ